MANTVDIIEALLFAADKPVPVDRLASIAGIPPARALEELGMLREEKARIGALQVVEVAGGWQFVTKPGFASHVRQLRDAPRQKLSRAAFEVLAIVAYRQPVTRAEAEELRGVECSGPLQFLLEKKLITLAGRKESPGRPWLYSTTPRFLEHFGLRSLADLPTLQELAQLNAGAGGAGGESELFNRGSMQAPSGIQPGLDTATSTEAVGADNALTGSG